MSEREKELMQALENVRTAIMEADKDVLVDTFWMPAAIEPNCTVVDYIDSFKPCEHVWDEGFNMLGPTLRCKKCHKFVQD